jgi:aspartate-semialdehyde dehydrogenase
VSCPNCTTIVLVMTLAPILRAAEIDRVVVTSCQSVSGAGKVALDELESQIREPSTPPSVFDRPIAYNCLPQIGSFQPSGYTSEEEKIIEETRKILERPDIQVVPTAVRVPVRIGHAVSVNIEFNSEVDLDEVRALWNSSPGVRFDETFATPLEIAGTDDVVIGRLRRDPTRPSAITYWAVGDNLRKGAATNSVQIAEVMVTR